MEAGKDVDDEAVASGAPQNRPTRLKRIAGRLSALFRNAGGDTSTEDRMSGRSWRINVSDWPVGKADYDLGPDEALEAVRGLSNYYETAMTTLANTTDPDEGPVPDVGAGS